MITLKNAEQIEIMKHAGRITGEALALAGEAVREGVTTKHLDDIIRTYIEKQGAKPSFLGYSGFPASACISVNEEIIHGIPSSKRVLEEGDIVKIDVGAFWHGYHGDSANTFPVGKVSREASDIIEGAKASFEAGISKVVLGNRIGDIGAAVDAEARSRGYSVVRKYIGHGLGAELHEQPDVPNYGTPGRGPRLAMGMVFCIEPMINAGTHETRERPDRWTVVTADGKLSAHYEHTVAITPDGVLKLTYIG
nr:type I methionyl aminopeptidase [Clostridia bacterium]